MSSDTAHERRPGTLDPLRRDGEVPRRRFRRGVYLLPSLFTIGNLFCGYACVAYAMRGELETAAPFIGFAVLLDILDGRIARLTRTTSAFGREFDSLADVVSFGMAPALLVFRWGLEPLGRLGWAAGFVFVSAGAIRLARFNIQTSTDKRYFVGMPIPAAAGLVATVIIFLSHVGIEPQAVQLPLLLIAYLLAFLMVSTVKFNSFKDLQLARRKPFNAVIVVLLLIFFIVSAPQIMLFSLCFAYVLSGPTTQLVHMFKKRQTVEAAPGESAQPRVETKHGWQKIKH